ncbi:pimeloyl-ACP methyl ester carboxylesterase [Actinoplanes lutulentus]|uniref:Pimeloyl-ACP methyl ester carboxylesterase n=1 Tax=Actinoplanes lutulentus TaxID=1287878 RepID=A0A327YXI5_9ACTN|nr:alpha/beta hydrolase [Actinoplanes lutulentus]MBB2943451.1 pimeloyl-ACP methyl ester carboxylesterase [Actinoplanes lutulentus]RAK26030.1 pimeloyl-ACP methyl ester carboxylesterase [Actinoplanes lutulentus]
MTSVWSNVATLEVNGIRLGYREAGCGSPAVLLHGTGSWAGTWDRFAPVLLARGHRVIAVDLRGHADSARTGDYRLDTLRDDLLGLVETLGLRDVLAIGHSVGGYAALAAAQHSPDVFARLVLEDLAAPPRRSGFGLPHLLSVAGGLLAARPDHELSVKASIFLQLSRPDPAWWERLREVHQPTLVLSGGRTSCIPPRRLADVTAALPDARLATIPVGHRVHSLAPEAFAAEVTTFLTDPAHRDVGHEPRTVVRSTPR